MRKRQPRAADEDDDEDPYVRDQRQKKEFEERLKKRDEEKTKKILELKLTTKEEEEVKQRREIAQIPKEDQHEYTEKLRILSRRKYLPTREVKIWTFLKGEVEDNERLFGDMKITKVEQQEQEEKKKILQVVENAQRNLENFDDMYQILDDEHDDKGRIDLKKRWELLTKRYYRREEEKNQTMNIEQKEWEDTQREKATQFHFGSQKIEKKVKKEEEDKGKREEGEGDEELGFVFEDQIDFIKDEIIAGQNTEALEAKIHVKTQAETLQEVRRSLPIWDYRNGILEAIEEHQILIVVGETGSGKTTNSSISARGSKYSNK